MSVGTTNNSMKLLSNKSKGGQSDYVSPPKSNKSPGRKASIGKSPSSSN